MEVKLLDEESNEIWSRWRRAGQTGGLACRAYISNGMQARVIDALADALQQARLELSCLDDLNAVTDLGASSAKVESDIPVSR